MRGGRSPPQLLILTSFLPYLLTYLQAEYDALDAFTPPALLRTPLEVSKY